MPVPVTCPSCASSLKAPDNAVGRKVRCPKCGAVIPVPSAEEVADSTQVGVQAEARQVPPASGRRQDDYEDDDRAPRARRRRHHADDDDDYDYEVRRRRSSSAAPAGGLQLGLGIAALAVGILGLLTSWVPVAGAVLCSIGLILGIAAVIVAMVRGNGFGFPIAGSAVSAVSLVISLILTFIILAAVQNAAQQVVQVQAAQMQALQMQAQMPQGFVPVGPPTPPAGAVVLAGGKGQVDSELTLADPPDRVKLQSKCKVFTVVMKAGRTYQIDMIKKLNLGPRRPGAFMVLDPFLRLEDSAGNQLAFDDDSGGNLNARIVFVCPQNGTFRVVATSLFRGAGAFTLTVEER